MLYYNDSIGTSPTRTIAGLRSFDQKVILIAGGYDKASLRAAGTGSHRPRQKPGADGCDWPRIEKAVRNAPALTRPLCPSSIADNMQHAVELARAAAKPGDIILSPASASFDLYPNFEGARPRVQKIVNALK